MKTKTLLRLIAFLLYQANYLGFQEKSAPPNSFAFRENAPYQKNIASEGSIKTPELISVANPTTEEKYALERSLLVPERSLFQINDLINLLRKLDKTNTLEFIENSADKEHINVYLKNEKDPIFEASITSSAQDPGRTAIILQNWEVRPHRTTPGIISKHFSIFQNNHCYFRYDIGPGPLNQEALDSALGNWLRDFRLSYIKESEVVKFASVTDIADAILEWLGGFLAKNSSLNFQHQLIFRAKRVQYYSVRLLSVEAEVMQLVVFEKGADLIKAAFTELDHDFEFNIPRKDFKEIDPETLKELEGKLINQNFHEKLTIDKIEKVVSASLGNDCAHEITRHEEAIAKDFVSFSLAANEKCFPKQTKLAFIRYTSGFLQFLHLKIQNEFFFAEYMVPCLPAVFERKVGKLIADAKELARSIHQSSLKSEDEFDFGLEELRKILLEKIGVDIDFTNIDQKKKSDFSVEGISKDKKIKCVVEFKKGMFKVILRHVASEARKGSLGAEVNFPEINVYDQREQVGKELDNFLQRHQND